MKIMRYTSTYLSKRTSKKSYDAACLAAGALTAGVDLLFQNKISNGFALVRPPGHHAEKETSKGF
jgi:acetoin utilization deacetylase AcuC-like enzyme